MVGMVLGSLGGVSEGMIPPFGPVWYIARVVGQPVVVSRPVWEQILSKTHNGPTHGKEFPRRTRRRLSRVSRRGWLCPSGLACRAAMPRGTVLCAAVAAGAVIAAPCGSSGARREDGLSGWAKSRSRVGKTNEWNPKRHPSGWCRPK